ncbi:DUF2975 domain-containing protein [Hymenobacter convexus]|uniref:DUF2975 domain-containing protein n=1 Tax=Hymenobacter sp. CA1UV-4 TaxID=3063782 RepID=UPI00271240D7|nr:DUF2975 domain-containing protein [Hymenobacter sp. CA1UV-4]MDO7852041.1 DUF2975 domain-containing protein [Hymenobacter sp. CA1UV-4]
MNRFTTGIITGLRYLFLVASVAGALALTFYLCRAFFVPEQPADVITLNVRQRPAPDWEAEQARVQQARQQLAGRDSALLLPRSRSYVLVQHEASAGRRLLLRLVNAEPQSVPRVVAALLFCWLVYRILRDLRPSQPFAPANVRRLRWLGVLLIGCDVYYWLAGWWLKHYLTASGNPDLSPVMDFGSSLVANWLIGLLLLLIATGYQRGVELAEDAEFTV